jgi:hypothetical protein
MATIVSATDGPPILPVFVEVETLDAFATSAMFVRARAAPN